MAHSTQRPRLRLVLAAGLLLAAVAARALPVVRAGDDAPKAFPEAWFGTWKGPARTVVPGGTEFSFAEELAIGVTDAPDRVTWTLRFDGAAGKQERPYLLVAKDRAKGLYAIDEGRGVELPATLVDGTLYTQFEVDGHRTTTRVRLEGAGTPDERLTVELVTTVGGRRSVVGGKDGLPAIAAWPVASVQAAVLVRAAGPAGSPPSRALDPDLERLATYLTGAFSNEAQTRGREGRRPIRLTTTRVRADRADGPWIRLEQAYADSPGAPYRALVYRLEHVGGDIFECHAFGAGGSEATAEEEDRRSTLVLRRLDAATFRGAPLGVDAGVPDATAPGALVEVTITPKGIRTIDGAFRVAGSLGQAFARFMPGSFDFLRVDEPAAPSAPAPGSRAGNAPPR